MSDHWTPEEDAEFRAAADASNGASNNGRADASDLTSWWPVDLGPIVAGIQAGEIVGPVPTLMSRTDGACLFYPGEVQSIAGEPETGKGWIALAAAAQVLDAGGHVLYLDFEDAPTSIITRLIALGVHTTSIVARFTYIRPDEPLPAPTLAALLATRTYQLAVIDGLSEAYTVLGLDPYSNPDAATFLTRLPRPIAATGAAVLLIDHVIKNKEGRGRYALGAQHKLAGIAAAYTTDAITPPSRTQAGLIKVKVEKDRHGHVRPHASAGQIALVHISPSDNGDRVLVTLEPPEVSLTDRGEFQPTVLMSRVSEYVAANPGACLNDIKRDVDGRSEWIAKALNLLVDQRYIRREKQGRSHTHHHLRTYTPASSPIESPTSPGPDPSYRVPESLPIGDSDPDSIHSQDPNESQ